MPSRAEEEFLWYEARDRETYHHIWRKKMQSITQIALGEEITIQHRQSLETRQARISGRSSEGTVVYAEILNSVEHQEVAFDDRGVSLAGFWLVKEGSK